jgi:hypothetical protein
MMKFGLKTADAVYQALQRFHSCQSACYSSVVTTIRMFFLLMK